MFYNFKYPIVLFLASFVLLLVGLLLKIMHWPGGHLMTGSMIMVQIVAIIFLIVIVLKRTNP
jgi:hypothetical protein